MVKDCRWAEAKMKRQYMCAQEKAEGLNTGLKEKTNFHEQTVTVAFFIYPWLVQR